MATAREESDQQHHVAVELPPSDPSGNLKRSSKEGPGGLQNNFESGKDFL
jgi:hypothetical protein